MDITANVRRIVEGKLARLERLLNDSAVSAQVVLSREKTGSRAEVTLHARGEKFLHGGGRADTLPVAVAAAVDKIVQQAQTMKGKWQARKRRGSGGEAAAGEATPAARPSAPARRTRVRMPPILKASRQTILDLSVSDAAARLDGAGGAVIFRDAQTARIAVLYRTPGGDLTLIETEA